MTARKDAMEEIANAQRIAVLTGAGISAESGIPTFRSGQDALWNNFDPEDMANAFGYSQHKARCWGWYQWRTACVEKAQPNAGHLALARLAFHKQVDVFTQNVDNLHERAGSQNVVHLHGTLFSYRCIACQRVAPYVSPPKELVENPIEEIMPPKCRHCKGYLRPGVVWFGENLREEEWEKAMASIVEADVLLVVGTSAVVRPVSKLPDLALSHHVTVIEINPEKTELTEKATISWRSTAGASLPHFAEDPDAY